MTRKHRDVNFKDLASECVSVQMCTLQTERRKKDSLNYEDHVG